MLKFDKSKYKKSKFSRMVGIIHLKPKNCMFFVFTEKYIYSAFINLPIFMYQNI